MKNIYLYIIFVNLIFSCKEKTGEEVAYRKSNCQGAPAFMKNRNIANGALALSTTEARYKGLWPVNAYAPQSAKERLIFQDSTWDDAGWLGNFLTDKNGYLWCVPVPVINVLDNPTTKQNTLWRVDNTTGKMSEYIILPDADKVSNENPYGILGLAYNCESDVVYVSSCAGSNRKKQNGKLYAIDTKDNKIIATLNTGDVFGLGISYKDGYRKLFFGSARNSDVYSVNIDEKGKFVGKIKTEFTIAGLGPRGDDIVRKIREEDKTGDLLVTANEFKFNLTAPTEVQYSVYRFKYNAGEEKWIYVQ